MTFGPSRIINQITLNIGFLKLELKKYSRNFHIRQIVNLMILFRHFRKIIKVGKIADGRFFKFVLMNMAKNLRYADDEYHEKKILIRCRSKEKCNTLLGMLQHVKYLSKI
jgi:hypothetical protein